MCQLADTQAAYSTGVFEKMMGAQSANYLFKSKLVCSYLQLLLHEGLRMQRLEQPCLPAANDNASLRLG